MTAAGTSGPSLELGLELASPEGIVLRFPLASLPRRCLAWLVDIVAIACGLEVFSRILQPLFLHAPGLFAMLTTLTGLMVTLLYAAALEWFWQGQTLGKRLLGLRVMDVQGLALGPGQVLARNLLRVVDMLPLFYLAGAATCLLSRRLQRLGDLAAGTVVVSEMETEPPDLRPWLGQKHNSLLRYPLPAFRTRTRVTPPEAGLVLEALLRRDRLEPGARRRLFAALATHFQAEAEFPPEVFETLSPEQYVQNIAALIFPDQLPSALPGPDLD